MTSMISKTSQGDGLSFRGFAGNEDDYKMTVEQRS
jgi:hypothetical protein